MLESGSLDVNPHLLHISCVVLSRVLLYNSMPRSLIYKVITFINTCDVFVRFMAGSNYKVFNARSGT